MPENIWSWIFSSSIMIFFSMKFGEENWRHTQPCPKCGHYNTKKENKKLL